MADPPAEGAGSGPGAGSGDGAEWGHAEEKVHIPSARGAANRREPRTVEEIVAAELDRLNANPGGDRPSRRDPSQGSASTASTFKRRWIGRERGGLRIGPMVFVPGIRNEGDGDAWAHRKGEPRVFALLWAVFLLGGAVLTVFGTRGFGGATLRHYELAALAFITVSAVGVSVLWPMVRLSQLSPARPVRAVVADLVVVLAPVHAIVWPMPLLTRWPVEIATSMVVVLTGWALLAGLLIALGTSGAGWWRPAGERWNESETERSSMSRTVRSWTMAAAAMAPLGAPLLDIASAGLLGSALGEEALLLSPLTAPWIVSTADAENLIPRVSPYQWWLLAAPGVVGCVGLLLTALSRSRPRTEPRAR